MISFPIYLFECIVLAAMFVSSAHCAERKPNIVFILADDLGYGDLGCYGQKKIKTPNLDRMAAEGMRFTQHYAGNAVCAPSRCVLMTGLHPGHAFIRDNRELQTEGQFPIPLETINLAKVLKQEGYITGIFGKWGLGGPGSSGDPLKQGFDRFFGYNCQRVAHNYYPTFLWDNDRRITLNNPDCSPHQKLPAGVDPNNPASYAAYTGNDYAPDLIMAQARHFVIEHKDQPFFLYLPTTVPHLALQVPEDSLAEYRGQWPDPPYIGDHGYLPQFAPRAAYAAMITRLDREVGRLMKLIQELDLDEKTIFVFTSDNGPATKTIGSLDANFFESAGPLRGAKGSLYEGGVREPMIVRWKGHAAPGKTSALVTGFEDWLPTLLDLAGSKNAIPPGIDGISFAPTLRGEIQVERPFLYREFAGFGGQQSVRLADWVGVRKNLKPKEENPQLVILTELYHLDEDLGEKRDLASEHPEIVAMIERIMREQHTISTEFSIPALDTQ